MEGKSQRVSKPLQPLQPSYQCVICSTRRTNVMLQATQCTAIGCNHKFCYRCLSKWGRLKTLLFQRKGTCPICRRDIRQIGYKKKIISPQYLRIFDERIYMRKHMQPGQIKEYWEIRIRQHICASSFFPISIFIFLSLRLCLPRPTQHMDGLKQCSDDLMYYVLINNRLSGAPTFYWTVFQRYIFLKNQEYFTIIQIHIFSKLYYKIQFTKNHFYHRLAYDYLGTNLNLSILYEYFYQFNNQFTPKNILYGMQEKTKQHQAKWASKNKVCYLYCDYNFMDQSSIIILLSMLDRFSSTRNMHMHICIPSLKILLISVSQIEKQVRIMIKNEIYVGKQAMQYSIALFSIQKKLNKKKK